MQAKMNEYLPDKKFYIKTFIATSVCAGLLYGFNSIVYVLNDVETGDDWRNKPFVGMHNFIDMYCYLLMCAVLVYCIIKCANYYIKNKNEKYVPAIITTAISIIIVFIFKFILDQKLSY